jgi:hypothetical protein
MTTPDRRFRFAPCLNSEEKGNRAGYGRPAFFVRLHIRQEICRAARQLLINTVMTNDPGRCAIDRVGRVVPIRRRPV